MIKALSTAATGLQAQSAKIEGIANDMANINTDAYKRTETEFHDLMYETVKEPGAQLGAASQSPVGVQRGMGVKVGAQHKIFEQGPARITNHQFDLMIEGRGFFPVTMPNGEIGYTRAGAFKMDAQGKLQLANGAKMIPEITVPPTSSDITVTKSGEIKTQLPNNGGEVTLGQLQLVTFQNEQGLMAQGDGIYKPSPASGPPLQGIPGETGLGAIQQGALEGSNVNIANSMVKMIENQRGFELNSKVMKTVDEMMGSLINVK